MNGMYSTFKYLLLLLTVLSLSIPLLAQNGALDFDGTDDYVSISSAGFPLGSSARSIEAWVKTTSTNVGSVFSYGANPGFAAPSLFMFVGADGTVGWGTGSAGTDLGTSLPTAPAINDGNWHHIAFTYTGATTSGAPDHLMSIYIDGVLMATKTPSISGGIGLNTSLGFGFAIIGGGAPTNTGDVPFDFDGQIDEVRIWNDARTEAEINANKNTPLTGNESDLISYYNFNEGSPAGTNLNDDKIGGTNDGTLTNFALSGTSSNWVSSGFDATPPTPIAPTAETLDFDGTDDYIFLNSTGFPFAKEARTIEAWVQTAVGASGTVFSYGANPGFAAPNLFMNIDSDGSVDWLTGSAGTDLNTSSPTTPVNDGAWHHIAFTYTGPTTPGAPDDNLMSIYVDGTLIATKNPFVSGGAGINTHPGGGKATIGATVPNNVGFITGYLDGRIDELRIWDVAKSAADIAADKTKSPTLTDPTLVAYFNFDQGQDAGINTSETILYPIKGGNANNGALLNFDLNGTSTSNWVKPGVPIIDYIITTTGGALVITDCKGSGDILELTGTGTNLNLSITGRKYQLNGGASMDFPVDIPLTGISSIEINTAGGNDTIEFGAIAAALPSLTVNGNAGNDQVVFNGGGTLTFDANADLDLDLSNDPLPTPNPTLLTIGDDEVRVENSTILELQGTGSALIRVSKRVEIGDNCDISTESGALTVEANNGATTAGDFVGVTLGEGATLAASEGGSLTVIGKGGAGPGSGNHGILLQGTIGSSATAATGSINVTGEKGANSADAVDILMDDADAEFRGRGAISIQTSSGGISPERGIDITNRSETTKTVLEPGSQLNFYVGGQQYESGPVADRYLPLRVIGELELNGAMLNVIPHPTTPYTPVAGDAFSVVVSEQNKPVTGQFTYDGVLLQQGAQVPNFLGSPLPFFIDYKGGEGFNVVIYNPVENTGSGNWDDPATWGITGTPPATWTNNSPPAASYVTISSGSNISIPASAALPFAASNIVVESGATLDIGSGSTLNITGVSGGPTTGNSSSLFLEGDVNNDGIINIGPASEGETGLLMGSGSNFTNTGELCLKMKSKNDDGIKSKTGASLAPTFTSTGILKGKGKLDASIIGLAGGTLAAGCSPGIFLFDGSMDFSNVNIFTEVYGTDTAGIDYDLLEVAGTATLADTLELAINYTPAMGDLITILDAQALSGTFVTPAAAIPEGWELMYDYPNTGQVSLEFGMSTPPPSGGPDIEFRYKNTENGGNALTNKFIKPQIRLENIGTDTYNLADFTIRYYFTSDNVGPMTLACQASDAGCSNTLTSLMAISPAAAGADRYLEMTFGSGTIVPGQLVNTKTKIGNAASADFDESDDFSSIGLISDHVYNPNITLYYQGNLVQGSEPNFGGVIRTVEPVELADVAPLAMDVFPNPFEDGFVLEFLETPEEVYEIRLLNTMGQVVFTEQSKEASMKIKADHLASGIYILQVRQGDAVSTTKLVKE